MTEFRYLDEGPALSSAEGLAGDEALALALSREAAPPTLRLYHYRPCVIVGRYQNLTDAVDLDACRRCGFEWNRRHTGGGTVVMGPDQVAVGLVLADQQGRYPGAIRSHFESFASVLARALAAFGIRAELAGKNDLQVDGRKIAGLAISQDIDGVVFFHASLLLDFDVALMVELLDLPTRDLDDRGQSCFSQRMTTAREHAPGVSFEAMKHAIVAALAQTLNAEAKRGDWTDTEDADRARLRRERYENDAWIYSSRVMRRWTGSAESKTPGGQLRVYVDVAGSALEAVLITGDYFCRNADLARLEAALKGTPASPDTVASVVAQHAACEGIYRIEATALAKLILAAASVPGKRTPLALEGALADRARVSAPGASDAR